MQSRLLVNLVAIVLFSNIAISHECRELPTIKEGVHLHKKTLFALQFMRRKNIDSVEKLEEELQRINRKNFNYWQDVANFFRHEPGGLACAQLVFKHLATSKNLRRSDRSFAYIGLSKIAEREVKLRESINQAENAILVDNSNGYAWLRRGSIFSDDVDREETCFKQALIIARETGDESLRSRAYLGLSQIAHFRHLYAREKRYLYLAHKCI